MSSQGPRCRARGHLGVPAALIVTLVGLVCAGILAMHHLGGGGHASGTAMAELPAHSAGAAMTAGAAERAMVGDDLAPAPSVRAGSPLMGGHTAGACLIVLLGGLLVLLYAAAGWQARRMRENQLTRVCTGGPRPGRGPPRDLLSQLCVLRT